jgi:hypothetical protein
MTFIKDVVFCDPPRQDRSGGAVTKVAKGAGAVLSDEAGRGTFGRRRGFPPMAAMLETMQFEKVKA